VTLGVVFHLPMFFGAAEMDYVLNGWAVDPLMIAGMALIGLGLAATVYGLVPSHGGKTREVAQLGALFRLRGRLEHVRPCQSEDAEGQEAGSED
jgi:uncharacterized membrane protein